MTSVLEGSPLLEVDDIGVNKGDDNNMLDATIGGRGGGGGGGDPNALAW